MRPPQAILSARAEREGPTSTSFIWQSEYKREFQWRKPLVPAWEKPRVESRDQSRNGSDRGGSDTGSESAASAFTTAMETLRDSRDSLARERPGAAHPAHRKHVNSPAPSIQEEYKNIVDSFTRPKSAAWSEATASGSSTPNLVGGRGLTRPYSPAASSRASSVEMQEEMDRRYGRKVSRPSSSSSRQFEQKGELADTRLTTLSKSSHNDEQLQQQSARVNLTKNIPYQPVGVARLRSPPSSVGSLDDYMNQDSDSIANLKAKTAKALLNSRIEGYQTEYQRQFQDWTEKIYGAKRDVRFSPSIATVQRTRAIPAAAEDDGVKYGILGNRVNDRESNSRAYEEGSNRRNIRRNDEMGENSGSKVEHNRLKAENLPAAGVAAYRGGQPGTNSSGRKKYEFGGGAESVAALMTHNENVDPHRISKEGLRAKDSHSNRGGNRILLYSVEPPPTWNLAQEILQKARQRRHEFSL